MFVKHRNSAWMLFTQMYIYHKHFFQHKKISVQKIVASQNQRTRVRIHKTLLRRNFFLTAIFFLFFLT